LKDFSKGFAFSSKVTSSAYSNSSGNSTRDGRNHNISICYLFMNVKLVVSPSIVELKAKITSLHCRPLPYLPMLQFSDWDLLHQ
jgi:hypothetical protein